MLCSLLLLSALGASFVASAAASVVSQPGAVTSGCDLACLDVLYLQTCDASILEDLRVCLACLGDQDRPMLRVAQQHLMACDIWPNASRLLQVRAVHPGEPASTPALRGIFSTLALSSGLVGLPLIVLTTFAAPGVRRDAVFVNFCVTWSILAVCLALLGLAGQGNLAQPGITLCDMQAALVDGALAMTPVSTMALVIQLGLRLREANMKPSAQRLVLQSTVLVLAPYVVFFAFGIRDYTYLIILRVAQDGVANEFDVKNPAYFCKITKPSPLVPFGATEMPLVVFIIVIKAITLLFEGVIGWQLYVRWRAFRNTRRNPGGLAVGSLIRLVIFSLYRFIGLGVALAVLSNPEVFPAAEFFQATLPFVVFLVFGTQMDILLAWAGWISGIPKIPSKLRAWWTNSDQDVGEFEPSSAVIPSRQGERLSDMSSARSESELEHTSHRIDTLSSTPTQPSYATPPTISTTGSVYTEASIYSDASRTGNRPVVPILRSVDGRFWLPDYAPMARNANLRSEV